MAEPKIKPGENSTRGSRPKDEKDARERGLRMDGIPDGGGSSRSSGSSKLDALVKAMDDIELTDQHDLHQFCESGRKLAHYLAVVTALAAGELEAGAKEMGHLNRSWGAVFKMRRVTKKLNGSAGDFGSAAAGFVAAWTTFEQVFGEIMDGRNKPAKPKRFTISTGG